MAAIDQAISKAADTYRQVLRIRRLEEACLDLRRRDEIAGSIHLCAGQEAIPVGATAALNPEDRVIATYRGHGWALACGVSLHDLLAEICQRADGINGGRAGSPYLMAPKHGFLGENSIVGAGVPIAAGVAMAAQLQHTNAVALVSFGDGAMSQGALQEGMLFAAYRRLPLVLVCEHNGWSEMTETSKIISAESTVARARALGIETMSVDGTDPDAVQDAVAIAVQRARAHSGPTFVECHCHRLWGHYNGDIEHYRPDADRRRAEDGDPVVILRARLLASGQENESAVAALESALDAEIAEVVRSVERASAPSAADATTHVVGRLAPERVGTAERTQDLTYIRAVTAALRDELNEQPEVIVYGEDVGKAGGIFGATRQLQEEFGAERVFDTPIAEAAILGSAVGAAISGLRPIVEIMWGDFLLVALDQLINQAANVRYVSRGQLTAPLVVRTQQGVTPGSCAQHSQSLEALLAHIPGLRVGLPATPQDAYSMLRAAVANEDPVILFESRALYQLKSQVTTGGLLEGLGGAHRIREGHDAAIITWGTTRHPSLSAAEALSVEGLDVAVLDLRWLTPLDDEAVASVVADAGGRVVIAHEANLTGGFGAEIAARIMEQHFDLLDAPVLRVGTPDVRIPSAPALQQELLPNSERISAAVRRVVNQ